MKEGISVIVCCFNSSSRLASTLEHLYLQKKISPLQWEIIVVDNASTDDTGQKAWEIWDSFALAKPAFRVVIETKPGLSSARSKGIQHSQYKFILFCDDDNWLQDDYLYNALDIMRLSPCMGALGGIGFPVFEKEEPPYFWKNQYHVLAVGKQWHEEGDITQTRGVLYGAGMVINKLAYQILIKEYDFEFQVDDRTGNKLTSSGDHELCLALKQIGYRIFYSKRLVFKHYIPEKRTRISYYKLLFLSFGESNARLLVYFVNKASLNSIKNDYRYVCLRCCKHIIQTWIVMAFSGYYFSSDKYKYIDHLHHLYSNFGILKRMLILRNSHKELVRKMPLFNRQGRNLCSS